MYHYWLYSHVSFLLDLLFYLPLFTYQQQHHPHPQPYYLTVAKYLKASHPDVLIEKRILPALESDAKEGPTFEVLVDGKVVVGKGKIQIQKLGSASAVDDATGGISIFVSMQEIDSVISKARRRRRPSTSYGDDPAKVDLDMLRKSSESNRLND
jgi:hypothetical protein